MALLGVQPWEEIGDFKFQAIAEGKNLDVVLQGWKLRDAISDEAVDLLQVGRKKRERRVQPFVTTRPCFVCACVRSAEARQRVPCFCF